MNFESILDGAAQAPILRAWDGSNAMVALYDSSHRRISLKLAKPHQVLFIVAIGCRNIRGPFTWSNSRLSIDRIDEEMTVVWDRPAGFELVCSLATIARGDRQQIWRSLTSHLAD